MNDSNHSRAKSIAYWTATSVAAVAFAVPAAANLAHIPHIARDLAHLGYPPYFLTILGSWKLLAAIAVLLPRLGRLKEWAYAGMIFDLTGAAFSRAAVRDGPLMVMIPLLIAGVVIASWALRPSGRMLERAA
ncbi:MAG TPA: DoxX family protein [Opitutus sp.]|nr:DoxX family protein [Opitutus sp.]